MLTIEVDGTKLATLVTETSIVFVDFWAQWCAPCKQFATTYEKVAKDFPAIKFTKVNIENETKLAETMQIQSIPHLVTFKAGIIIYSESGNLPESALRELVQQAMALDMQQIRAQMDKKE